MNDRRADTGAVLHKYLDFGKRALANISLPSGERVMLSIAPSGFVARRLHLRGIFPGRRLFAATPAAMERMVRVLARESGALPPLPQATETHRDDSAMMDFIAAATVDLEAVAANKPVPGALDALDLDNRPERPLSLLTRAALAAANGDELVRRFERLHNTPG